MPGTSDMSMPPRSRVATARRALRARRHEQAAGEGGVVGEELVDALAGRAVQGDDLRRASGAVDGNDAGLAGARAVNGGHTDAAGEGRVEREEAPQRRGVGAAEDGDVGAAAGAGADDR